MMGFSERISLSSPAFTATLDRVKAGIDFKRLPDPRSAHQKELLNPFAFYGGSFLWLKTCFAALVGLGLLFDLDSVTDTELFGHSIGDLKYFPGRAWTSSSLLFITTAFLGGALIASGRMMWKHYVVYDLGLRRQHIHPDRMRRARYAFIYERSALSVTSTKKVIRFFLWTALVNVLLGIASIMFRNNELMQLAATAFTIGVLCVGAYLVLEYLYEDMITIPRGIFKEVLGYRRSIPNYETSKESDVSQQRPPWFRFIVLDNLGTISGLLLLYFEMR